MSCWSRLLEVSEIRFCRVGQTCCCYFSILLERHCSQFWTCSTESEEVTSSLSVFCRPKEVDKSAPVIGLEDLDPDAAQQVFHANACCECSAWIAEQTAMCSQCRLILAFPEDLGGDVADCLASIWSCHEYWMLERLHEAERGAACLCQPPRRITEDPAGSSPTFPTCWLDCRRVGRLCSSLTQSWCIKVRFQSPAVVRFRTRRRKKQRQPHFRTQQQQFLWGPGITARRTHSVRSSCVLFAIPSFLFVSGLSL